MTTYELKLYVAGRTPKSVGIVEDIIRFLEVAADGNYDLKVVDVTENPQLAEKDGILATPVLEKVSPESAKIIVSDLSDRERFLSTFRQKAQQKEDNYG